MDDGAAAVECAEACQGELTIEDGSVGNGTIDADGAQARGVKGVGEVQGAQVVGGNGSMVSGGIVGAGLQLGAAEDVGAGTVEAESGATTVMRKKKTRRKKGGQQARLTGDAQKEYRRNRDKDQGNGLRK